eukprot:gene32305-16873_t
MDDRLTLASSVLGILEKTLYTHKANTKGTKLLSARLSSVQTKLSSIETILKRARQALSVNGNLEPGVVIFVNSGAKLERIADKVNTLKLKDPVERFFWADKNKKDLDSWNQELVKAVRDHAVYDLSIVSNQQDAKDLSPEKMKQAEELRQAVASAELELKELAGELLAEVATMVDDLLAILVAIFRQFHCISATLWANHAISDASGTVAAS